MTFGDLDKTIPDKTEGEQTNWTPFDWTSEVYQLMCRQYRLSLGIVHQQTYESKYYTASEFRYWQNLHKVRGYGPYERKRYFDGVKVIQHVIPDPPEAWQNEWASKRGTSIRDVEQAEPSPNPEGITAEQETIGQEHLKRLESACLKDEKGEIIAITDANLLSEFQIWMAQESLTVTDETAKLIRDSWTRIFDEDRKALTAKVAVSCDSNSTPYEEFD